MKLGNPPPRYDLNDQSQMRAALEQADAKNHKQGRDIEVGATIKGGSVASNRIIFTDTATGKRYPLVVTNGALALGAAL